VFLWGVPPYRTHAPPTWLGSHPCGVAPTEYTDASELIPRNVSVVVSRRVNPGSGWGGPRAGSAAPAPAGAGASAGAGAGAGAAAGAPPAAPRPAAASGFWRGPGSERPSANYQCYNCGARGDHFFNTCPVPVKSKQNAGIPTAALKQISEEEAKAAVRDTHINHAAAVAACTHAPSRPRALSCRLPLVCARPRTVATVSPSAACACALVLAEPAPSLPPTRPFAPWLARGGPVPSRRCGLPEQGFVGRHPYVQCCVRPCGRVCVCA
jgi:hypothetical protein